MWTRRAFLKAGGLSLLTFGAGPSFLGRAALGAPGPASAGRRRVLVALFQRGAMDGLAAVPPLGEERRLRRLRPRLAMSGARKAGEEAVLDLGTGFGFHPALAPLVPLWRDGRLAVVHAVGSPDPTRSHFDAQDYMESGTPGRKGTGSGWLNRVAGSLGHEASPFRSVSLTPAMPRSLYGPEPAVAVSDLSNFRLRTGGSGDTAGKGFEALYRESPQELLREAGSDSLEAARILAAARASSQPAAPEARYPRSLLGRALRQIALLIKADVGLEVAFAESRGWDTHVGQGTTRGSFSRRATDLAAAVTAFWNDLGAHRERVVVMTMTEFGRTVAENGSGGTDHGHGSCLFVLGDRVAGGRVHGRFPGLSRGALFEGRDLAVTTDFRAVFSEVAAAHLGVPEDAGLFPAYTGGRLPLFRSA